MAVSLESIATNRPVLPPRILLYGPHGLGKTTFGANAPRPVFILTEDGLGTLQVPAFPLAITYQSVLDAAESLDAETNYSTVVVDSLDWLDTLVWAAVNSKYKPADLAYGRGAVIAADLWLSLLERLQTLRSSRGMAVLLLAHSEIKRFDSPEVEPYDRYQPKLQARSSALVQEWCDVVAFVNTRVVVRSADVGFGNSVARGVSSGERVIYLAERPAFLAKNRYGLPDSMPLDWAVFQTTLLKSIGANETNV